jgi:hypothetical protein
MEKGTLSPLGYNLTAGGGVGNIPKKKKRLDKTTIIVED